jgi:HPt (histidine-containing phosphotransfer) domain-containing protein
MTLAFSVRSHLQAIRLETLRSVFVRRAKSDAEALASCRSVLGEDTNAATVSRIREIAHGLAGAAGLFGYQRISSDAAALEEAVAASQDGDGSAGDLTHALDCLMSCLANEWDAPQTRRAHAAQA